MRRYDDMTRACYAIQQLFVMARRDVAVDMLPRQCAMPARARWLLIYERLMMLLLREACAQDI